MSLNFIDVNNYNCETILSLKEVLLWLFKEFEERNISYCILRNYTSLPEINLGSDIDLLVGKRFITKTHEIFMGLLKKFDLRILEIIKRQHVTQYRFYKYFLNNGYFFLQIDLHWDEQYLGGIYLKGNDVLKDRQPFKSFYIPSSIYESIISLFTKFLPTGRVKEEYRVFINRVAVGHAFQFKGALFRIVGNRLAQRILEYIKNDDWDGLSTLRNRIRSVMWFKAWCRSPLNTIIELGKVCFDAVKFRLFPPGITVCILGVDGSGKSSTAEGVLYLLKKAFISGASCILHWRPSYLPSLRSLFNKRKTPFKNLTSHFRLSLLISLLRFNYYIVDIIIGYYLKVYNLQRQNAIIIFDRYAYDFFIDPQRYGFNLPKCFFNFFLPFIPKPDLIIYLDNTTEHIYERKQELPIVELKRQVESWREFIPKLKNARIVASDRPLKEVINEVTRMILNRRAEMTKKILKIDAKDAKTPPYV